MIKKPRQLIIFGVIILVVVIASAAFAIFLSMQQVADVPSKQKTSSSLPQKTPVDKKADEADKLAFEGDVNGGVQVLDNAIKNTDKGSEQAVYYSQKATLLFNNKEYVGALTAAKKAFELQNSSDSAAFVGQINREKGDTAEALNYYKKAISLIDKTSPFANDDTAYYQSVVKELEQK